MISRFFMLGADLLIPLIMLGFGYVFTKKTPKKINMLFGYRTTMSVKNEDTWDFAHKYCGKIWVKWGVVMVILTLICFLFTLGSPVEFAGKVCGMVCYIQLVPLIVTIFMTERALKKNFDKDGNRLHK